MKFISFKQFADCLRQKRELLELIECKQSAIFHRKCRTIAFFLLEGRKINLTYSIDLSSFFSRKFKLCSHIVVIWSAAFPLQLWNIINNFVLPRNTKHFYFFGLILVKKILFFPILTAQSSNITSEPNEYLKKNEICTFFTIFPIPVDTQFFFFIQLGRW